VLLSLQTIAVGDLFEMKNRNSGKRIDLQKSSPKFSISIFFENYFCNSFNE
jgi:hypothetical protein